MQFISTDFGKSYSALWKGYRNHATGLGELVLPRMFELTFHFSRKQNTTMALVKIGVWHETVLRLLSKDSAAKVSAPLFAYCEPSAEIRALTGYVTVATEVGTTFFDLIARRRLGGISVDIEEVPMQRLLPIYEAQRSALLTVH